MDTLYDRIESGYDATRRPDPHIRDRLKALLSPIEGGRYVDVACGTGNYTLSLAKAGIRIVGFDASARMITRALQKDRPSLHQGFVLADVGQTPFRTAAFNGAVCTLAIHHFPDLMAAFCEIGRLVDPVSGRLVLLTALPLQMKRYWLCRYFPTMLRRSWEQMPDMENLTKALHVAGFSHIVAEPYEVTEALEDLFLYSGKHRPQLYLDAGFRAGISSFANLADAGEVAHGLDQLGKDIKSGAIYDIIRSYSHKDGDYLFIRADR
ncbi:hypothetical protein GCM10007972_21550 [Iodidimonas muriae]|uniref:Methyltransferase type 11 domain-containing protein n=1 Tax=Iodidimonas muriae TaxID=261467 RepID=A0ABQ2LEP8_9PROT|nr:class I SAM-dependent methyltransferase [Iodidimonas muriae]GER07454.1 hypothetical protein JCM17843_17640 [Kordiimonadales bacterium JCM 17843]GGO14410.1 hypothetical protein GCM10007972_21550 [Iodidimonas muriae]